MENIKRGVSIYTMTQQCENLSNNEVNNDVGETGAFYEMYTRK